MGVDRFSKKLCFYIHRDVSFRVAYFPCKDVSDPCQRTVPGAAAPLDSAVPVSVPGDRFPTAPLSVLCGGLPVVNTPFVTVR